MWGTKACVLTFVYHNFTDYALPNGKSNVCIEPTVQRTFDEVDSMLLIVLRETVEFNARYNEICAIKGNTADLAKTTKLFRDLLEGLKLTFKHPSRATTPSLGFRSRTVLP